MARLKEKYRKEVAGALAKEFGITNPMAIPRVEKIVVNMGVGDAMNDKGLIDSAVEDLMTITVDDVRTSVSTLLRGLGLSVTT